MILHTGIDGTGPVDLFGQHQAGQLMGHGDAAHTESEGCGFFHLIGQAVGGADDKRHIPCPAVCAVGQELRQLIGGDLLALNWRGWLFLPSPVLFSPQHRRHFSPRSFPPAAR